MRLLVLVPPKTAQLVHDFATEICGIMVANGDAAELLELTGTGLARFCRAIGCGAEGCAAEVETLAGYGLVTRFRPDMLLVPTKLAALADTTAAVADVLPMMATTHLLAAEPSGQFSLVNVANGEATTLAPCNGPKAAATLTAAWSKVARIGGVNTTPLEADALATAAIRFRVLADQCPGARKQLRMPPVLEQPGALESLVDGEVLLGDALWVKGWIDWDKAQFAGLILQVSGHEWPLELSGFRHDVFAAGGAVRPRGFSVEVDVGHVACEGDLSLWVEDRAGRRRQWLKRRFWISRGGPLQSTTPLITGKAQLVDGSIRCNPRCKGTQLLRMTAWQDGHLVARWSAEVSGPPDPVLDVTHLKAAHGPVHLHVAFAGYPPVPWTTVDLATGIGVDATAVVTGDRLDFETGLPAITWPAGPLRLVLDGKPAGMIRSAPELKRDCLPLSDCAGQAILEAVGVDGRRRSIRLFRICRTASLDGGLPVFVMPAAAAISRVRPDGSETTRVVLIRRSSAPTDELYVLAGLEALTGQHRIDLRIVDLVDDKMAAKDRDILLCRGAFVIVSRYLTDTWIGTLGRLQRRLAGIYYLMDDDVTLAENDTHMPPEYRQRMVNVAHGEFQALLHLATRFVVTSNFLSDRFASDKTDLLTPPYIRPCESFDHLDDMSEIRIEYHGTQVHRADLDAVAEALVKIHRAYPNVRIRTFMGRFAPRSLSGLSRVEIVPDLPWPEYRAVVAASRAHIALAPMLGTPYNRAKSFVKIMDIARLGAAGIYSRTEPYESVVSHGRDGLLLENDVLVWRYAMEWLIQNPVEIGRIARAGQKLATRLSAINHPADYWRRQLFESRTGETLMPLADMAS